ncbi:MAG: S8 family serine peptidase [Candidatus Hatepunaea meridiana]|nr:S8 family serine peptidase [Candidatus Hatepunaea meridiana]
MKNLRNVLIICIGVFFSLQTAEAYTFNGKEYTQIDSIWYEVYCGENYEVIETYLLVEFYTWVTDDQRDSLNQVYGGEDYMKLNDVSYCIRSTNPTDDPFEFCEDYLYSGFVAFIKNVVEVKVDILPEDEHFERQQCLYDTSDDGFDNDIDMDIAWNCTTGNEDVLIGVIDTGLLYWHEDIVDNLWQNTGEDADDDGRTLERDDEDSPYHFDWGDTNGVDDDENGFIDDLIGINVSAFADRYHAEDLDNDIFGSSYELGNILNGQNETRHGTKVASTIGSRTNAPVDDENTLGVAGIAGGWGEDIIGCKIVFVQKSPTFDDDDERALPDEAMLTTALNYMLAVNIDILNISLHWSPMGGLGVHRIHDPIFDQLKDQGKLVVCSAGNNDTVQVNRYPSCHQYNMKVGASYNDRRWARVGGRGSNYGPGLQIMAPSGYEGWPRIYLQYAATSTGNDDEPTYDHFSATSCAAPMICGVAGLLLSHQPLLTREELYEILLITADKSNDDEFGEFEYEDVDSIYGTWASQMGYGELNAGRALQYGNRLAMDINAGWTMISSNLEPYFEDNGLDDEDGIYLIFDEIADDDIIKLQDNNYNTWIPGEESGIPCWDYNQGYYIKLSDAATWVSLGRQVEYNEEIDVEDGWNIVSYFPEYRLDAPDAFLSLCSEDTTLIIAKDSWGHFYVPGYGFNNMDSLSPGYGYQIQITEEDILIYPDEEGNLDAFGGGIYNQTSSDPVHFRFASRTGEFHPIILTSISVDGLECESGDEIGVFTQNDLCIGATVFSGEGYHGLTAWKDDTTTIAIDGYRDNDIFYLRYWDADRDLVIEGDSLNIFSNLDSYGEKLSFSAHDLLIGDPSYIPGSFTLDQNYPNPFNSQTIISYSLPQSGHVNLKIYDIQGRHVCDLVSGQKQAGWHKITWNGSNAEGLGVSSGVYFYKIKFDSKQGGVSNLKCSMVLIR